MAHLGLEHRRVAAVPLGTFQFASRGPISFTEEQIMNRLSRLASPHNKTVAALAAAASFGCAFFSPAASAVIPGTSLNPTLWLRADAVNGVDGAGNPNALPAADAPVANWVNVGTAGAAQNAAQ